MSVDNVKDALKHSKAPVFFGKIENFVVNNKAYSILVESGANNIVKSLNEVSVKLRKQEEDSLKTIEECEAEFLRSQKVYSDLKTEIQSTIEEENYEESLVNPMSSKGYEIVFSEKNIEQTSVNITTEICKELSWKMRGKMLALKGLESALKNGIKWEKLECKYNELYSDIRSIFERAITNQYGKIFKVAILGWADDVLKGNDEAYKNYAIPVFQRIDKDIRRCWNRCNDENIQCYSIKELPQNLEVINFDMSKEFPKDASGKISNTLTDHISASVVNVIIGAVITSIMTYIGGWIGIIIAELFTGVIWLQLLAAIIGMLVFGGGAGKHFLKTSMKDLTNEERKIFELIHPMLRKSVNDNKHGLILKLKDIPRILVVNYKNYYKHELLSIECKLKNEIDKRRAAKKESMEKHQNFATKAKKIRETMINPIIKRLNDFIESCCI